MCGLVGFLDNSHSVAAAEWPALLDRMGARLKHRGPDDHGHWLDVEAGAGLSHRRLAVLDLSPAGHQPMLSASGRYVIAFNGEIYNHMALRDAVDPVPWRGHSDTETLLAALEAWGIEKTLQATVGMFALALWDRAERTLTLARDRMGEKPLYYGWQGSVLLFGSELKALRPHPAFVGAIDRDALALLLRNNAIGAPHSIYQGIRKLPPGTWVRFPAKSRPATWPDVHTYWSLIEVAKRGIAAPFEGAPDEAVERLQAQLTETIGLQRLADVPLGAFLSGGVDSSTVVALMQAQAPGRVRTYSIGFQEEGYDEAQYARVVARHLGTDHTELYVAPRQALELVPELPDIWDEPFADPSQIPTYLVAKLARTDVTVALSGDGGDELFGGYSRYTDTRMLWRIIGRVPAPLRRLCARILLGVDVDRLDALISRCLPGPMRERVTADRVQKLAEMLSAPDGPAFYRQIMSHWKNPSRVVLGANEPGAPALPALDLFSHMMLDDAINYLPTDILTKVDRAAMSVSLETRVPLLDHRVVEFAWSLPNGLKERDGQGKWPLRQVLYRHVPRELVERPKMGFGVPLASWLRGPLLDWAEGLLNHNRLRNEGFFDGEAVNRRWQEHRSGKRNWHYYLWDVLMFQAWLERHHGAPRG